MSLPKGTKFIVNADCSARGITSGGKYEAMGGLPDLDGATFITDDGIIGYLHRNQFKLEGETDEQAGQNPSTEDTDKVVSGIEHYLTP